MVRCSCVRSFTFVCLLPSLHSVRFGQMLRCAHKRIVNIMKVYMDRSNIQVELIRFRKHIDFIRVYICEATGSLTTLCGQPIRQMAAIGHEQITNYPFAR